MSPCPQPQPVTVVGIGADGWTGLSEPARAAIGDAEVLYGSTRQLALIPEEVPARRIAWPSPLLDALDELLERHAGQRRCVLATGDPLLSGIGTTLVERLGAAAVRIVPAESSVTLARARLGWSFEATEVLSSVARSLHRLSRALAPERRVLVLSTGAATPGELAALLTERGYGPSMLTVLENLGGHDEQTYHGTARDWPYPPGAALNMVAIHCRPERDAPLLPAVPGLADDAFEHDGQLTKRDVRAAALARLCPIPGQLLWDVGAGAGSVAIEWCRAHPNNRAVAIERDPTRAERITRNAERLGVPDLRVVAAAATAALLEQELPTHEQPDAIFLGGGVATDGLLASCAAALGAGGRLVAHAVTLEAETALSAAHARYGGELIRIGVEHARPLGGFTGWEPARTITQWSWAKEGSWAKDARGTDDAGGADSAGRTDDEHQAHDDPGGGS